MGSVWLLTWAAACASQIGVGSTREEVIATLGEPTGRSSAGSREVLNYPAGQVFLREGRVDELDAALVPATPEPASAAEPEPPVPAAPPPKPAAAPAAAPAPAPEDRAWIKHALIAVGLCVILLLGRHWIRVAKRAQAEKKADLLSR